MRKIYKVLTPILCFAFVFIFAACDGFLWLKGGGGGGGSTVTYKAAHEILRGTYTTISEADNNQARTYLELYPEVTPKMTYYDSILDIDDSIDVVTFEGNSIIYTNKSKVYSKNNAESNNATANINSTEKQIFDAAFIDGKAFGQTTTETAHFVKEMVLTNGTTQNTLKIVNPLETTKSFDISLEPIAATITHNGPSNKTISFNMNEQGYKLNGTMYFKFAPTSNVTYCLVYCNYTIVNNTGTRIAFMRQSIILSKLS